MPGQVLLIASYDSQLKWVAAVGHEFRLRGFECSVVSPQGRTAPSAAQLAAAGVDGLAVLDWDELVARVRSSDVVVAALAGSQLLRLTIDLAAADSREPGPVLVTGWVGLIYEQITTGYLNRVGFDVLAVNSVQDLAYFSGVAAELGFDQENLLLSGLPFLGPRPLPQRGAPVRRVLYADQPTVPGPAAERRHLYQRLIDYAYAHPEREVLLKPRHRPGEDTFHRMKHHPADLLAGIECPANFRVDYTPISEILPTVDLLVTMSSTACLEAVGAGCRVGLVLDFGVQERYGNHAFLGSGLLRTVDQLIADDIGSPDPEWLGGYFFDRPGTATEQIADRVEKLLASGERPSHAIWESDYFTSAARYRGSLPVPGVPAVRQSLGVPARRPWSAGRLAREVLPPVLLRQLRRLRRHTRGVRGVT